MSREALNGPNGLLLCPPIFIFNFNCLFRHRRRFYILMCYSFSKLPNNLEHFTSHRTRVSQQSIIIMHQKLPVNLFHLIFQSSLFFPNTYYSSIVMLCWVQKLLKGGCWDTSIKAPLLGNISECQEKTIRVSIISYLMSLGLYDDTLQ